MSTQTTGSPSYQSASKADDSRHGASERLQAYGSHYVSEPARDLGSQFRQYAKEKPDVAAMWCFALGIVVGWKLRG